MLSADLLIRNACIRTMDPGSPEARSMAVFNGSILAVSQHDDLGFTAGPDTIELDLGGKTVLPGFIDAHEHLSWFAENDLKLDLSPRRVLSLDQLKGLISQHAQQTRELEWIRGFGYDDTKVAEGRLLTRNDLDQVAPHHPVIVVHVSGHWAVVNSRALEKGNLNRSSKDPEGGSLGREPENGRLNGLLLETAMFNFAVESLAATETVVPPFPRDVMKKALQKATAFLNSAGFTGVGDALCSPSYLSAYLELAARGLLTLRVNMIVPHLFLKHFERGGLYGGWGNEWARAAGIKIILDGAIAGRTAAMKDGYQDNPDDHGLLLIEDQSELDNLVQRIHDMGYQACIHANGDLAIEMALNAIEGAMRLSSRPNPRHRIEHCTMIDDHLLERMAKLGVIALPFTSYLWQHAEKLRPFYGDRADRMFAHKSFLNAGIIAAAASDHPVGLHSALLGVQCMVTRKTPGGDVIGRDEKISLAEAFKVYTTYAAYASGEENIKGSLTPGRLADMVVLEKDPWESDPEEIGNIGVVMTIVNGKIVFNAESA
jgi:predicted amidohydrolase YtcJ